MKGWIDEKGKDVMIFTYKQLIVLIFFMYFLGLLVGWVLL